MIVDGLGSSEAGGQLSHVSAGGGATTGTFPICARQPRAVATTSTGSSSRATTSSAGSPRAAASRSATSATRRRPPAPTRWSTVCATRCPATGPACVPTASSNCTGATRSPSTPAARRSSPRRSRPRSRPTRRLRLRRRRPPERTLGQRGRRRSCACARGRRRHRRSTCAEAERHVARYKLPKAFVFVDRDRALPARQGRLPLGQADRHRRLTPCLVSDVRPHAAGQWPLIRRGFTRRGRWG